MAAVITIRPRFVLKSEPILVISRHRIGSTASCANVTSYAPARLNSADLGLRPQFILELKPSFSVNSFR
jgi:hypothetical protein